MIRTTRPVVIDSQRDISRIVYMKACNRVEDDVKKIVQFDVEMYVMETQQTQQVIDGQQVTVPVDVLVKFRVEKALYKMSTFDAVFPTLSRAQYDAMLMEQIVYVNTRTWTGTELYKTKYWDLTADDMEIVTA